MSSIPLPGEPKLEAKNDSQGRLVIEPLYPGYGTTLGNLLRRILLSSLSGIAVKAVKFEGADHEFSTLPHVAEDGIQLLQNIKQLRIKAKEPLREELRLKLSANGEGAVKAGGITVPAEVEIANPDLIIANLTSKVADLNMEMVIASGIGYVPSDQQLLDNAEVGLLAVDSIYTPIKKVGMDIENVRVGKMTNYHRLVLDIETDGTRTPAAAVDEALEIILEQLNFIKSGPVAPETESIAKAGEKEIAEEHAPPK